MESGCNERLLSVAFVKCLLGRLGKDRALGLGAEMAFWLFLSFLPLSAVAGLLAAKLHLGESALATPIMDSMPAATRELVMTELDRMSAWHGGEVGIGATAMFLWLASSGIASVFDGVELEAGAKPRSWLYKRALAIGACVVLSAGVATLTLLATGLDWIRTLLGQPTLGDGAWFGGALGTVLRLVAGAVVSFALVAGLYWIAVPKVTRKAMPIAPGALCAVVLQTLVGLGYGFFIGKTGDGGAYQAGLASIGVTMTALYLLCVALLVGTELNQILGERKAQRQGFKDPAEAALACPGTPSLCLTGLWVGSVPVIRKLSQGSIRLLRERPPQLHCQTSLRSA